MSELQEDSLRSSEITTMHDSGLKSDSSGKTVQLNVADFKKIFHRIKTQERTIKDKDMKLQAMNNLNLQLYEKQQEVLRYREKSYNCELALLRSNEQLARYLKGQSTAGGEKVVATKTIHEDSKPVPAHTLSETTAASVSYQQTKEVKLVIQDKENSSQLQQTACPHKQPCLTARGFTPLLSSSDLQEDSPGRSVESSLPSVSSECPTYTISADNTTLDSQATVKLVEKTTPDKIQDANLSQETKSVMHVPPIIIPGVSKGVFESVVQENVKLQKKLKKLQEQRSDVETSPLYIHIGEHKDIVEGLQKDLEKAKIQIEDLRTAIKDLSNDHEPSINTADLLQKNVKLEHASKVKEPMLRSYLEKVKTLEDENLTLIEEVSQLKEELQQYQNKPGVLTEQVEGISLKRPERLVADEIQELQQRLAKETRSNHEWKNVFSKLIATSEETKKDVERLTKENIQRKDENVFLTAQLHEFQSNFDEERKEKNKIKQHYESVLRNKELNIRKLSAQLANFNKVLQEERTQRRIYQHDWAQHQDLQLDVADNMGACYTPADMECPRCFKRFGEIVRYQDHVKKCMD